MNYKKIYDDFIKDRLNKQDIPEYYENHHIIPKSLNGSNDSENMIKLTASDHFFAHVLLARIYPNSKMKWALKQMLNFKRSSRKNRLQYEYLKSRLKHDKKTKDKISNSQLGKKLSEETKKKISIKGKNRKLSNIHKTRIKNSQPHSRPLIRIKGNELIHYKSVSEAAKINNLSRPNINACLSGKTQSCGGYYWKYENNLTLIID